MDFSWSDQQIAFRDEVEDFAATLNDDLVERDRNSEFSPALWEQCADFGIQGMLVDKAYSGTPARPVTTAAYALEGFGYRCQDNGLALALGAQMWSVQGPIEEFGTEAQRERWLPEMATGEAIGCFGLTEPDFGSNPAGMRTRAERDGDGWVLNGSKMWITNGSMADVAVVWAKTGELDEPESIRGFLVETDRDGFSAKDQEGKLSLLASDTSELVLQDVRVPEENLLPGTGGLKSPLMCLTQARYGIVWGAIGAAMACYREALEYGKQRTQFEDEPIAGTQIQQVRLVEMLTEITKAQLMALRLGRLKDQGEMRPQQVSMAKRNNVDMACECAREARRLLGQVATDELVRRLTGRRVCSEMALSVS